jgi:glucose dehydrogenase
MAVTAFGLIQVVLGTGAFMIVTGLALFLAGLALYKLSGQNLAV